MNPREFSLRYARWIRPLLVATGIGPRWVKIELSDTELTVRAGVWFTAVIPRSSIRAGRTPTRRVVGDRRPHRLSRRLARQRIAPQHRHAGGRSTGERSYGGNLREREAPRAQPRGSRRVHGCPHTRGEPVIRRVTACALVRKRSATRGMSSTMSSFGNAMTDNVASTRRSAPNTGAEICETG